MIRDLKTSKNKQTKNRKKSYGREKDQKISIIKLLKTNEKVKV